MGIATTAPRPPVIPLHLEREARATGTVGMILFLASWAMMFGALFYAYTMLRMGALVWPPPGAPEIPLLVPSGITLMLAASSGMLELSRRALGMGEMIRFQRALIACIVLGALFLGVQSQVWFDLWGAGLTLALGPYGALFYFLTIFHALHVVVGLGILGWLLYAAPRASSPILRDARGQYAAMFWHFVGAVWLIIFALVYVF